MVFDKDQTSHYQEDNRKSFFRIVLELHFITRYKFDVLKGHDDPGCSDSGECRVDDRPYL